MKYLDIVDELGQDWFDRLNEMPVTELHSIRYGVHWDIEYTDKLGAAVRAVIKFKEEEIEAKGGEVATPSPLTATRARNAVANNTARLYTTRNAIVQDNSRDTNFNDRVEDVYAFQFIEYHPVDDEGWGGDDPF